MAFKDWSETASDNDDADASINWAEGQAPSTVNGSAREMMAKLKTALGHIVSVKEYGATGDGTTDDTTALQAAIDAVETSDAALYLPAGTYKISSALVLHPGLAMIGAGQQSSIIKQTADATALRLDQATDGEARHLVLEDFGVQLDGVSASATTFGLNIVGTSTNSAYNRIARITISGGFYNDFRVVRPIVTSISDCLSVDPINDGFVLVGDGTSIRLERCFANNPARYGYNFVGAITYSGLETCACDSAGSHGYYFAASTVGGSDWPVSIDLNNCGVESAAGDGFHIIDGESYTLAACRALSCTGDGIELNGARGIVLNAFRATGNTGYGVNPSNSATPKIPSTIIAIGCTLNSNTAGRVSTPSRVTEIASTDNNIFQSPVSLHAHYQTGIPAGGTAGAGFLLSTTANFGIFFGSSAPTLSAAKGSLYLRTDGTGNTSRAYINTDGGTTWTNITTAG